MKDFWKVIPAAKPALEQWYKITHEAEWAHFADVRKTFNHADIATTDNGNPVVIFAVGGNKYRLIAALHYNRNICYLLRVLTHKQYETNRWRKDL